MNSISPCSNNNNILSFEVNKSMKDTSLAFIDLFAGIGGFHFALDALGLNCVFASEIDLNARKTYYHNFKNSSPEIFNKHFNTNIKDQDYTKIPHFDILCGGFPCQPFSIAGYRKGFNDKNRGDLIFNIFDVIKIKKPRVVFLENVKNLFNHDKGNTYLYIKNEIKKLGYYVTEKIMNTMEYGNLPQNRERLYIIGFKNKKEYNAFEFPKTQQLTTSLSSLLESKVDSKYYYKTSKLLSILEESITKKNTVYQ